ncbi:MAG TPA: RagB/SusD family nutrient uptake outer membrane protein [Gemmatimonadales bacterium]|nr:RagB/SusD family nutrient uptake outer membrane protein [Gemmatimonadales bacterium]
MRSIRLSGLRLATLVVAPLIVLVVACSEITSLEQSNPGSILARDVYTPTNAKLLVSGAIGDFECALHRYVVAEALLGDELVNAFASVNNFDYDRRTMVSGGVFGTNTCGSGAQNPGVYTPLSVARGTADTIYARLSEWTDAQMPAGVNRTQLLARSAAYAGYSLLLLGEGMCSAAINIGPELSKTELWNEAKLRFDAAIAASTATDTATLTNLNLARVGRARTLLNLGQVAAAGADAALVPAGFIVNATANAAGTNRQQNQVFLHTQVNNYSSVDPSYVGLTFGGVADPRVAVNVTATKGSDGVTFIRQVLKYASRGAAIPIARYAEARLILAEANIAAGNLQGAIDIINALHTAAGLPAYNGAGQTAAQVKGQVIEERRRELFMEGQRLGDMNRYLLLRLPADGGAFPNGGTYGTQACPGANAQGYPFGFPLPDVERNNNPNIP